MTLRFTCGYALLFAVVALASRYDVWLTLPPVSIHQWRQADGAALAWHYAQNPDFFEPKICNLFQTDDAHAVGELPLFYWFSGLVTRCWGFPEYPLRWLGLVLLFAGGWAFGWMILHLTKRPILAALGSGLLLTSPILAYYGPNFLPDAPAFCFVPMMAACLFQAEKMQSGRWLCAASVAAALAVSLKLSMAILPLSLAATWFWGKRRQKWEGASIWNGLWPAAAMAGTAVIVAGFRCWITSYNASHHATYFLTETRPIWRYDWLFIKETIIVGGKMALPVFASAGLYLACLGSFYLSWRHRKATDFATRTVLSFAVLGSATYVLLWFRMLREHDYYLICLLAIPALLLLNGLRLAVLRFGEKRLAFALSVLLLLGIWHAHFVMSKRLRLAFHPQTSLNLPPAAFLTPQDLTEAGIPPSARMLCPQDPSPNIALLALKRHGWTAYNFGDRITADTLRKYQTNFGLTHLALRDSAFYSPSYRQFFPKKVSETGGGWHLYSR